MSYRVALYERLSKEDGDKEESNSIESQRRILKDYLNAHDDLEFAAEFEDDGFTGTNFDRPGFQAMMQAVYEKRINCIVVKDLSRFGRNYLESGKYIQQILPQFDVRFIAVNDAVDTGVNAGFDFMLPIKNIFNESYSQDISRKVQSSFRAMQRSGEFCGAYASYGYKKSSTDKHKLIIDPYAAEIVRQVFRWYMEGVGKRSIAAKLNAAGVLPPSEYKKSCGENYRNSKKLPKTTYWTYSTVARMLNNMMYKGCLVQNKSARSMRGKAKARPQEEWIIVEGTHEPIIAPEEWDRVQELLKQNKRQLDFTSHQSVFAGFLKCPDCDRALVKRKYKMKNGGEHLFYTCGSYSRSGTQVCSKHYIKHEVLEEIVLRDLNAVIQSVSDLKAVVEEKMKTSNQVSYWDEKELEKIEIQYAKVKRFIREAYSDYKEGLLTREQYLDVKEDYQKQEAFCVQKIAALKEILKKQESSFAASPWILDLLHNRGLQRLDRDTLVRFVDQIYVYEPDATGNQKIKIQYRFSDELDYLFETVYTDK